jgi:hypothetical protein
MPILQWFVDRLHDRVECQPSFIDRRFALAAELTDTALHDGITERGLRGELIKRRCQATRANDRSLKSR